MDCIAFSEKSGKEKWSQKGRLQNSAKNKCRSRIAVMSFLRNG